jgi:hypothetical protein
MGAWHKWTSGTERSFLYATHEYSAISNNIFGQQLWVFIKSRKIETQKLTNKKLN